MILARLRTWWPEFYAPDPWPGDIDREVRSPDAVTLCHRCFLRLEYAGNRWFCSGCGAAIGPYNNIMPFIRIFSIGEVLRSGVDPRVPVTTFTACGYALAMYGQFFFFFPFYLGRLCWSILQRKRTAATDGEQEEQPRNYGRILAILLVLSGFLLASTILVFLPYAPRVYDASPWIEDDMDIPESQVEEWPPFDVSPTNEVSGDLPFPFEPSFQQQDTSPPPARAHVVRPVF